MVHVFHRGTVRSVISIKIYECNQKVPKGTFSHIMFGLVTAVLITWKTQKIT